MKKILILSGIILSIFLTIIFNCQQPTSSSSGGGSKNKSSALRVIKVAAGYQYTVALFSNGTVKCWGDNYYGQLGYGDTNNRGNNPGEMGNNLPTVDLGTGKKAIQIATGSYHIVVLLDDGTVKCWGNNEYGQLGYEDTENRGDEPGEMGDNLQIVELGFNRKAVQIAAGDFHTAVILEDGNVKCWGYNYSGQLGIGTTNNLGDNPGEMPNNSIYDVSFSSSTPIQIAAGYGHTVVLLDNGTVKCWGYNVAGQLGYGNTNNIGNTPFSTSTLPAVDLGTGRTAVQIAAGSEFTAVLLDNGTVKCWGRNNYGQLGYGDTNNKGDNSGEMGDSLQAVDLGTGRTTVQIAAGSDHTVALLNDGNVKCWGYNNYGQLGYGDTNNKGDNPGEMGDALPTVYLGAGRTVMQIAAGSYHTIAFLDDGTVKCWGYNNYGQLGYGDTNNKGDGSGEMGDNLPVVDLW